MDAQKFQYLVPSCIDDAIALRQQLGESSRFIAGGTEVVPMMTRGKLQQTCLIELTALRELTVLEPNGSGVRIGAGVTLSRLHDSPLIGHWHALAEASASIREPQVRNRGTVGGNVAHGVPSADLVPALLALEATIKVKGVRGERLVPIDEFLIGPYKTALTSDELVVEIQLPEPERSLGSAFLKMTKYGGSGLSVATVAAAVSMQDGRISRARVAIGSAGPIPRRVKAAEEFLEGKIPSDEVLSEAGQLASAAAAPRDGSIRATPTHRRRVLKPLAERAIALAVTRSVGQSCGVPQ